MSERRRAENDLPNSDQRFRLMVESVKDYAIFMLDARGGVASWNLGAERIKGWREREILGRHFSIFYTAEDVAARKPDHELAVAEVEGRFEDEGWRIRKDGSRFWANVIITALFDEAGNLQGFTKVTRDITERKLREDRLRLPTRAGAILAESLDYDTTLQRVADLLVPLLADCCTIYVVEQERTRRVAMTRPDPAGAPFVERLAERVIRARRAELIHEAPKSYLAVPLHAGERSLGALILVTRNGDPRYTDADVELAQEVARRVALALDNSRLYREATEAIRVRDEFLSIASHELKTPLTPLQLQLENIRRGLERMGIDDEKLDSRLSIVLRQTQRLQNLVESLLDVSRITAGRLTLDLEETDLPSLVREVIDRFRDAARAAGSAIELHLPRRLTGRWDRLRIEQVIANLVSNAIKYGMGKPIEIAAEEAGPAARVRVRDHGLGIAADQTGRIFDRFERAASVRHYGGMGLGLFIAHQIVDAHGGSISVDSTPGEGSAFTVLLPLTKEKG